MTEETRKPTTPKQTLRLIILPMTGTFGCMRTNLHLVYVPTSLTRGGILVHHLFFGVLIAIPAAPGPSSL
jgi:hypothetical protein